MRMSDFERSVSLVIKDRQGAEMRVSAVFHQDAHYLRHNRIALIGTRDQQIELLRLDTDGEIDWTLHTRPDWNLSEDGSYKQSETGKGWVRSSGMTQGLTIADDSIQPFADLQILESCDRIEHGYHGGMGAKYVFLQRPHGWYVHNRAWRTPDPPRKTGVWKKVKLLGIKFRLLQLTLHRDDARTATEVERLDLPGIEMAPIASDMDPAAFYEGADRLWFLIRLLLVFRFRQFITPLQEVRSGAGKHNVIWHSVKLEPRERARNHADPPFLAPNETYLAKGATALLALEGKRELLHAAAYGYASSYTSGVMETGLTLCVEGIERLIEAFEQSRGLTRETVDKKRWNKLGRAARKLATPLAETPTERQAIERALSMVPTMTLIERITRMVAAIRPAWRKLASELLEQAPAMIKMRNDIVHGRMVEDMNALRIELMRAQVLFERIWLAQLNCGDLRGSGWPLLAIRNHDADVNARAEPGGSS